MPVTAFYRVVCDTCGDLSDDYASRAECIAEAIAEGWWQERGGSRPWRCPGCADPNPEE